MSNYKSKTPEEAFDRSQGAHMKASMHFSWDTDPDVQVRRLYHDKILSLQEKFGRILPYKYRKKVFDTIEKKVKGGKK